jgi:hypothetical protein
MKYKNQTIYCITILGPDGKDYACSVLADSWQQLEEMIKAAGIDAHIAGELGVIASEINGATADQIVDVLNSIEQSQQGVKQ